MKNKKRILTQDPHKVIYCQKCHKFYTYKTRPENFGL